MTAGALALLPAALMLWLSGAVEAVARTIGQGPWVVIVGSAFVLVAAGALYGRVFMRAANDFRGGWLFGASYGFLVWMLGAGALIPWALHKPLAVGPAAQGILAAHLLFGVTLGVLFPFVHRRIMSDAAPGGHGAE